MDAEEEALAVSRITRDRGDVTVAPFSWTEILVQFKDLKIYGFSANFSLLISPFSIPMDSVIDFGGFGVVEPSIHGSLLLSSDYVCFHLSIKVLLVDYLQVCSLRNGMGFSVNQSILLSAPVITTKEYSTVANTPSLTTMLSYLFYYLLVLATVGF